MASEWLVEVCCRACGTPTAAPVTALAGLSALPCADPACGGQAALPPDLADTAELLFEESRRRLQAAAAACA
jgi:hypothetical protein